ncbi:helix-turn-helix transcriptional regulator [Agathobaculum sp. NTUH-O15-33]|uniref:helix-turn-helix domain-containing protein n=1 Tax=Agathobaculum sp. NTUH-O15-33 TaxID=3079302 RepID=UPI0029589E57|nr:helix-turn-helix transcriptional regulator [Agathobaculum sp. NTUH-O15-33]WNX84888.1 helix-turn-helix transcriptional regulator [Agathobaculum sp. NTUH-O15-33]
MQKQTLGNMIASLRKERGMTQAELAAIMNITDKAVSKWERDLSCPDIASLPKLAETLQVSVDELMQVRERGGSGADKQSARDVIGLVFKAVTLAMGVAVVVLSRMKALDTDAGFTLLGIGVACAGICLLQNKSGADK